MPLLLYCVVDGGEKQPVEVDLDACVEDVRKALYLPESETDRPLQAVYQGRELEPKLPLADAGVCPEAVVEFVTCEYPVRITAAAKHKVTQKSVVSEVDSNGISVLEEPLRGGVQHRFAVRLDHQPTRGWADVIAFRAGAPTSQSQNGDLCGTSVANAMTVYYGNGNDSVTSDGKPPVKITQLNRWNVLTCVFELNDGVATLKVNVHGCTEDGEDWRAAPESETYEQSLTTSAGAFSLCFFLYHATHGVTVLSYTRSCV
eukprot:TRINITY_DN46794_c0_g1_i1.p1 TRINITY_DN46794_c0_g1~~TRINITY_DN46794_c0_g1_i1.p1  ORF type:complete len:279 (+),score=43.12 TRINITY_DN46794_c0_g1_i1:63-839(+)